MIARRIRVRTAEPVMMDLSTTRVGVRPSTRAEIALVSNFTFVNFKFLHSWSLISFAHVMETRGNNPTFRIKPLILVNIWINY